MENSLKWQSYILGYWAQAMSVHPVLRSAGYIPALSVPLVPVTTSAHQLSVCHCHCLHHHCCSLHCLHYYEWQPSIHLLPSWIDVSALMNLRSHALELLYWWGYDYDYGELSINDGYVIIKLGQLECVAVKYVVYRPNHRYIMSMSMSIAGHATNIKFLWMWPIYNNSRAEAQGHHVTASIAPCTKNSTGEELVVINTVMVDRAWCTGHGVGLTFSFNLLPLFCLTAWMKDLKEQVETSYHFSQKWIL